MQDVSGSELTDSCRTASTAFCRKDPALLQYGTLLGDFEAKGVIYEGHDELVYVIKGEAELGIEGQTRRVGPGSFYFVPDGTPYDFKVTQAWHEKYDVIEQTITIGDNETQTLDFTYSG